MKKTILYCCLLAIVVVIAYGSYRYIYRADCIAQSLSRVYGVPVSVANVKISKKGIKLKNVVVNNPSNYTLQPAFSCSTVILKMNSSDLMAAIFGYRPVVVREMNIMNPIFSIEMVNATGSQNNWKEILTNVLNNADAHPKERLFHLHQTTFQNIAVVVKNSADPEGIKRSSNIATISMGRTEEAIPISLSRVVYWVTKLSLVQIGKNQTLPDFTESIENIPAPKKQANVMKLT